jgi:uncharacterized protein (DUF1697 family)
MLAVLKENPFSGCDPRRTYVHFLPAQAPRDALAHVRGHAAEQLHLGGREIYVYYPLGMGQSRLQIPAARLGTARNMNTVAKLVAMCSQR